MILKKQTNKEKQQMNKLTLPSEKSFAVFFLPNRNKEVLLT